MSKGIDYGMGTTNIDKATGIRFGVISQNEVLQSWCDSSESDYGAPTCGHCGNEATAWEDLPNDEQPTDDDGDEVDTDDFYCESCKRSFGSDDAYGDEPCGFYLDDGEYKASAGTDGDIFILSSPYFTRAQFCSPCAPGACYLTNPCDDGERAYCFGHDWFDEGKAPYPVYSVATGEIIEPS